MLSVRGPIQRLCQGATRRDFLQIGAVGWFGLSLPQLLRASKRGDRAFGKARRCILLFLTGGPSQLDTWDLKPVAPERIRGEFKPIATNVVGMQISELFPKTARHADKLCIVRSVTHPDRVHTSAGYTMLTGSPHPAANSGSATNIKPGPNDLPHVGSLLAKFRPASNGVPAFVSLPEAIKDAGVNLYPGLDGGLLGKRFAPFRVDAEIKRTDFRIPDIFLPHDMSSPRLQDRRVLLGQIDQGLRYAEFGVAQARDGWYQKAFELIGSSKVANAFALDREPAGIRDQYGNHLFGQGCLLARRLLEAGVGLAAVYWHYEGPDDSPVWDTHQKNFPHLRNRLMPPTDAAMSALLNDLDQRGMLDDTLVVCMGEFGRSPHINKNGGREHWPDVQSVVFAGAGIRGGSVFGASDRVGGTPAENPVTPADLTATIMHLLGLPGDLEISDLTNRPMRACQGKMIEGIVA